MVMTWNDFFEFCTVVIAVIALVVEITKNSKRKRK